MSAKTPPYFKPLEGDQHYVPTNEDFENIPPFSSFRGRKIPTGPSTFSIICAVCLHQQPLKRYTKLNTKSRKDYDCACMHCRTVVKDVASAKKMEEVRNARFKKQVRPAVQKQIRVAKTAAKRVHKSQEALKRKLEKQLAREQVDVAIKLAATKKSEMSKVELEFAQRTLIRRKLLPFIQKFQKNYQTGWVHVDICERLDRFVKAVENQESPRLMLFMPPRHGKSEIASKNLPAHIMGNHPTWEIISASYAVSLPMGFSKKIHATMADPYYKILFPNTRLHPKAQATDEWMTTLEGAYVAAGVGGGITGKGAHVLIIDDPVKDAQEADSQGQRDSVWDWWGSTAKTRLAPGGGVLIIQTRWHDDDLSGRLLMQMKEDKKELNELIDDAQTRYTQAENVADGEKVLQELAGYREELENIDNWEVVQYPAVATFDEYVHEDGTITDVDDHQPSTRLVRHEGDPLHEARYPKPRLMNMKRSMQKRHWSALYQQNPVPDEGMYFTKDMFRLVPHAPAVNQLKLFSAWDLAIGEKQVNDYTVGVVGGIDWMGQLNIVEVIRFRGDSHFIADAILNTYKRYPTIQQIGIEQGQLQMAIMPTLVALMKERRLYPSLDDSLRPITDKQARARPLQGMMQQGRVIFPSTQLWFDDTKMELLRFPGGLHDDIVDALAWLAHMCVSVKPPVKPGTDNKTKSWKHKLNRYMQAGTRVGPMGA